MSNKWRMAKSIEKLRNQLDARFPNRSKASDGGIGDAKHATRKSDHNPWVKDKDGIGVVTARDFTFDNNPSDGIGINCQHLADVLSRSRDPRIKYIIWNSRITVPGDPSKWKKYTGPNPHNHHLHLSVHSDSRHYDSTAEWKLSGLGEDKPLRPTYTVKPGDTVSAIIKKLNLKMVEFYQFNNFTGDNFDPDNIRTGDIFFVGR